MDIHVWLICFLTGIILSSTDGKTFYLGLLNRASHDNPELILSTSEPQTASITHAVSSCDVQAASLTPTYLYSFTCAAGLFPSSTQISDTGIKVEVNDDVLHATIRADGKDESTLVFAEDGLGMEFLVVTQCDFAPAFCQFSVVATDDQTTVMLTFPTNNGVTSSCTGEPVPFLLNKLQVLHIESTGDLSGAVIATNKDVAAFSGGQNFPSRLSGEKAHFIEQLIPKQKLGNQFVFVPNHNNAAGDLMKLVTSEKNTIIEITGHTRFQLSASSSVVQKRIDYVSVIKTNHPVLVAQFMSVDIYLDPDSVYGQPSMLLVPAVSHYTNSKHVFNCFNESLSMATVFNATVMDAATSSLEKEDVKWSETYKVRYGQPTSPHTLPLVEQPGDVKFGGYAYCGNSSAALSGIDLTTVNTDPYCTNSPMAPGDEIDNDCDGSVDEDTCTLADLERQFQFTEGSAPRSYTISGATETVLTIQSCAISLVRLTELVEKKRMYLIQFSTNKIVATFFSEGKRVAGKALTIQSSPCTIPRTYWVKWDVLTGNLTLGSGIFYKDTRLTLTPALTDRLFLDSMGLSALGGDANFTVDVPDKDCGMIFSVDKDIYGISFVFPILSDGGSLYYVPKTNETANCEYGVLGVSPSKFIVNPAIENNHTIAGADKSYMKVDCDKEVGLFYSGGGFTVLPVDTLGVRYVMLSNTGDTCYVASLQRSTRVRYESSTTKRTEITLAPYSIVELTPINVTGTFVTADKPIALFCSHHSAFPLKVEQMPPITSLGKKFTIPSLTFPDGTVAKLRVVASEDSTLVSVTGDYDEDTMTLYKGDFVDRTLDLIGNYTYSVETNKAALVALILDDSDLTIITPQEQYDSECRIPFLNPTSINSEMVKVGAAPDYIVTEDTGFATPPITNPLRRSDATGISCLSYVDIDVTDSTLILGGMNLDQINKVCTVDENCDNDCDCDDLNKEEHCGAVVAGVTDSDIDGSINEDCANGTTAPTKSITIALTAVEDCTATMAPPTTTEASTTTGSVTASNSGSLTQGTTPTLSQPVTVDPTPAPLTKPPVMSLSAIGGTAGPTVSTTASSPTTASLLTSTLPPESICDCVCPCAWVIEQNYTKAEIAEKVEAIKKKLRVDKSKLSSQIRKKISVEDNRPTSVSIGYIGIVFMVVTLGFLVLLDITTLKRDIGGLIDNLRQMFQR